MIVFFEKELIFKQALADEFENAFKLKITAVGETLFKCDCIDLIFKPRFDNDEPKKKIGLLSFINNFEIRRLLDSKS